MMNDECSAKPSVGSPGAASCSSSFPGGLAPAWREPGEQLVGRLSIKSRIESPAQALRTIPASPRAPEPKMLVVVPDLARPWLRKRMCPPFFSSRSLVTHRPSPVPTSFLVLKNGREELLLVLYRYAGSKSSASKTSVRRNNSIFPAAGL
jgi:hypothetical protein